MWHEQKDLINTSCQTVNIRFVRVVQILRSTKKIIMHRNSSIIFGPSVTRELTSKIVPETNMQHTGADRHTRVWLAYVEVSKFIRVICTTKSAEIVTLSDLHCATLISGLLSSFESLDRPLDALLDRNTCSASRNLICFSFYVPKYS